MTQFIGLIPPGRAPDHFHTYDEVIYVLDGEVFLEIDGEQAKLQAGSCIHLPARLVHCLANTGDRRCASSASSARRAHPPRPITPTGPSRVMEERS